VTQHKGNLISGACLAAFGGYVVSVASKLPYVSEVGPGPGFFPLWIGLGLLVFASPLMATSFLDSMKPKVGGFGSWNAAGRAVAGWLALMAAIALFHWVGFSLSFVILTVFLIVALDRRSPLLALGVGIGLAVVFHLIFVVALDVSLPQAPWGF
jgi:putative tricarboxylic transport membrane protein